MMRERESGIRNDESAKGRARKALRPGRKRWWLRFARYGTQAVFLAASAFSLVYLDFFWIAAIMAVSLVSGAWFCGWACPLGAAQDWLGRLGALVFRRRVKVPYRVERFLRWLRYPLLGSSLIGFAFAGFLGSPYRNFFGLIAGHTAYVGAASWCLLGAFLAASLLVDRPFCRYFCLEGAGYGLLSLGRLFTIRRDAKKCVGCGACDRACPTQVRVSARGHVRHPGCVNCMECLAACPVPGCLEYSLFRKMKGKGGSDEGEKI